jgi:hypothetical protein
MAFYQYFRDEFRPVSRCAVAHVVANLKSNRPPAKCSTDEATAMTTFLIAHMKTIHQLRSVTLGPWKISFRASPVAGVM